MLFLSCPPRPLPILRKIWEEEVTSYCKWERDDSIDDEKPAPYETGQ